MKKLVKFGNAFTLVVSVITFFFSISFNVQASRPVPHHDARPNDFATVRPRPIMMQESKPAGIEPPKINFPKIKIDLQQTDDLFDAIDEDDNRH